MGTDILSVGIDIGTSTTQVVFSRLCMENTASFFSIPRVSIVDKEVVYKSDIVLTPLKSQSLIDGDAVRDIVSAEFKKAGFSPKDTRTGAVIITGESARKENSAIVLEKLSDFAGDFVVSTAGPDMEAIIAGKGSGAQQYSQKHNCRVVNLDIGGGTTNIVVFDCGEVTAKGCLDIGGRLIKVERDLTVSYISPSAQRVSKRLRIPLEVGKQTSIQDVRAICQGMNQCLEQLLGLLEPDPLLHDLQTPGSTWLDIDKPVQAICFSGGVADYIYRACDDYFKHGDMGVLLAEAIRSGRLCSSFKLIDAKETIRATVVGAGIYTTSISGSTITHTGDILPLKNVPVLKLDRTEQNRCFAGESELLKERITWFLSQSSSDIIAISMEGIANPSYEQMKTLAQCIAQAASSALKPSVPILLVVEHDIAKALGQLTYTYLHGQRDVISIDAIKIEQNDYMDIGKPLMDGLVIPVVVKTLIFG